MANGKMAVNYMVFTYLLKKYVMTMLKEIHCQVSDNQVMYGNLLRVTSMNLLKETVKIIKLRLERKL